MNSPFTSEFVCFAHRGASGYEPENTLRSFSRALELGAQWIELDVRVVEDQPIIFHDRTLRRRTGVGGVVEKLPLSFLRSLDAGKGEKIPLLSEVTDLVSQRAKLQLELKSRGAASAVAAHLSRCLSNGAVPSDFLISSFDFEEALLFTKLLPQVPVGLLIHGYPRNPEELAHQLSAVSVHINLDAVTPKRVADLHSAGLKVFVYTVNEPADLQFVRNAGVDGVFTDFPDRVG